MSYTPVESCNWNFTNDCHEEAKKILYPTWFKNGFFNLEYETASFAQDTEEKIDRIIKVQSTDDTLKAPMTLYIQERFRRSDNGRSIQSEQYRNYLDYLEATITEWNNNSDLPAEFYGFHVDYFVTGFWSEYYKDFLIALMINIPAWKQKILNKPYHEPLPKVQNNKGQDFVPYRIEYFIENKLAEKFYFSRKFFSANSDGVLQGQDYGYNEKKLKELILSVAKNNSRCSEAMLTALKISSFEMSNGTLVIKTSRDLHKKFEKSGPYGLIVSMACEALQKGVNVKFWSAPESNNINELLSIATNDLGGIVVK